MGKSNGDNNKNNKNKFLYAIETVVKAIKNKNLLKCIFCPTKK
jgi:hypothetical protein